MEYVIGFLLSLAASLVVAELLDWTPRITKRFIRIAASRLPEPLRERYREEWLADIGQTPGRISQLAASLDLIRGANAIAQTARVVQDLEDARKAREERKIQEVGQADKTVASQEPEGFRRVSEAQPSVSEANKTATTQAILNNQESEFFGQSALAKMQSHLDKVTLTPREWEILRWVASGKGNCAIGKILGISEHGVEFHVRNIQEKLGTDSRISTVVKALHTGLINL